MKDFLTSPLFLSFLVGMIAMIVFRAFFGDPSAERAKKAEEYAGRLSPEALETVKSSLGTSKIEAIKLIRAETNIGLKEAQDVVRFLQKKGL